MELRVDNWCRIEIINTRAHTGTTSVKLQYEYYIIDIISDVVNFILNDFLDDSIYTSGYSYVWWRVCKLLTQSLEMIIVISEFEFKLNWNFL